MTKSSGQVVDILEKVTKQEDSIPCLQPYAFLVAWHGVLTLAFCSWPAPLAEIKKTLNEEIFTGRPEAFGSRWPKMTLAAIRDDAPDPSLDASALAGIFEACDSLQSKLHELPPIQVRDLSIVSFGNRTLSKILARTDISFHATKPGVATAQPDKIVESVLKERFDPNYISKVTANGNRVSHYENLWTETTLVAFLEDENLGKVLDEFERQVENVAPQRYQWMPRTALHLTVRSLDSR